jgi:hypothetical protein
MTMGLMLTVRVDSEVITGVIRSVEDRADDPESWVVDLDDGSGTGPWFTASACHTGGRRPMPGDTVTVTVPRIVELHPAEDGEGA